MNTIYRSCDRQPVPWGSPSVWFCCSMRLPHSLWHLLWWLVKKEWDSSLAAQNLVAAYLTFTWGICTPIWTVQINLSLLCKEKKEEEDNVWWIIALSLCSYWKLFEQSCTFTFASIQLEDLGVLYVGGKLAGISRLRWSISTILHYFSDRPVLVRAIQTIEVVRAMGCRNSMPWNLPFERSGS